MQDNSIYATELQVGVETEVLSTKDMMKWLAHLLIHNDIDRLEKAILNTYTKDDSNKIIACLNTLLEIGCYEPSYPKVPESRNIEEFDKYESWISDTIALNLQYEMSKLGIVDVSQTDDSIIFSTNKYEYKIKLDLHQKEKAKELEIELGEGMKFNWDNGYNFKKLKGNIEEIRTEIDIATVEDKKRSISVYLSRDVDSTNCFNLTYSLHNKTAFYDEWQNVSFEDIQIKDIKSEEELINNMVEGLNKFYISQKETIHNSEINNELSDVKQNALEQDQELEKE